ncbi:hypothetical protein [Selenomonas ruminis]|uniref:Uncharacterized protein n=1 Tax=Selenomonas ruminis TaxID=2593411 RepID=A0A5D6W6P8_9FIRM|nr:hypothetical protein [Selenomonas sp. mPRGC5]TYZ23933.1 hypothetical protein FZ040_04210 [Selenomonas sp. mPRGC5]
MSDYTNFQVGEAFPLPIKNQQDGGMFQVDANGCMFILQLSHTDIIAIEAFRTGKMELGLYEQDGLLFFLYQIDGIFKEGWGDAPFSLSGIKDELMPTEKSLRDPVIHLYLVDTTLKILLAQRDIRLNDKFMSIIRKHVQKQQQKPFSQETYRKKVQQVWAAKTSAAMREKASAVQEVNLDISIPQPPKTLN